MITKISVKKKGRQPTIQDPTIFSIYPGQRAEPLSETADKIIAALKQKYTKTKFYANDSCEGYDIKIQQNSFGGEVIQITQPTLDSVRKWTEQAYTKLDEIIPKT